MVHFIEDPPFALGPATHALDPDTDRPATDAGQRARNDFEAAQMLYDGTAAVDASLQLGRSVGDAASGPAPNLE